MNQHHNSKSAGSVETVWNLRTYDVWGNAKDGYDVNDTPATRYNIGTPQEFVAAYPSDRNIRLAFGLSTRLAIETDGDDLTVCVKRAKDGYPIGEMHCTSHESLSPVRRIAKETR